MTKETIKTGVSVVGAVLYTLAFRMGTASANAITDLGTRVNTDLVTPGKVAFILVGGGIGVTVLVLAGILAAFSHKMWKGMFVGGMICLFITVFAPVMASVITGLATSSTTPGG